MKNAERLKRGNDDAQQTAAERAGFGKKPKREIWAVDSETDPFKVGRVPRPFIWGAYNGSEYHEFDTVEQFLSFITVRNCVCYAHNGGRFDWHYLLEFVPAFTPVMVISGRLAKFSIREAEFRDSFNIMPMPLRAGGQKFEIDDYSIFEAGNRDVAANRETIRHRLRTDCLYLFQMLETFFMEFGYHLTISTASMSCWSAISKIEKPTTSAEFFARFQPYYFGGRVECLRSGVVREEFKIIDINSAYPYAMTFKHPWGEVPYESQSLPNSRGGIQRSFIRLRARAAGAFPYRGTDGSLEFPADGVERVFFVSGWEFLAALETGVLSNGYDIETVLQLPTAIEFNSYMNHFYKMKTDAKAAGDAARYEFSKRFLCSLYGKFGSNPENYHEYELVPPRYIDAACEADGYEFCCELGPHALLQRPLSEPKKRFYNVAVAASITGFVRAYDWRAMCAVRRGGGTIFYIDTDCLHATATGDLQLHDTELGAWKIEAVCDYGAYAGKKLYACKETPDWYASQCVANPRHKQWKTASKGVKLSAEEITRVANGETIDFCSDVPQYSMKRGINFVPRKIRKTAA